MPRPLALAVLPLALLAAALGGCTQPTRLPPPEPSAAVEPLFASDEEALAAATAAYEEYLAVSNAILQDGGREPERLLELVSAEVFETELEGFELFLQNDWRATGSTELEAIALQQVFDSGSGAVELVAYVCTDVSSNGVVDAEGVSQVSPDRPVIVAHEVLFVFSDSRTAVIQEKVQWDPSVACIS
jgi:hypothetical protein